MITGYFRQEETGLIGRPVPFRRRNPAPEYYEQQTGYEHRIVSLRHVSLRSITTSRLAARLSYYTTRFMYVGRGTGKSRFTSEGFESVVTVTATDRSVSIHGAVDRRAVYEVHVVFAVRVGAYPNYETKSNYVKEFWIQREDESMFGHRYNLNFDFDEFLISSHLEWIINQISADFADQA